MSNRVCDTLQTTSIPCSSASLVTVLSRLRLEGSVSYSYVSLVIFHWLNRFGKTSSGFPLTTKSLEEAQY